MAKSLRKHTLCTPLSIDQLYIFGIFKHKWGTRKHIDDLKKYSWCIPVQKKIKPIIWRVIEVVVCEDTICRVVSLINRLTTIKQCNYKVTNINRYHQYICIYIYMHSEQDPFLNLTDQFLYLWWISQKWANMTYGRLVHQQDQCEHVNTQSVWFAISWWRVLLTIHTGYWEPTQYPIRRLIVWCRKVLNVGDLGPKRSGCRAACQISSQSEIWLPADAVSIGTGIVKS